MATLLSNKDDWKKFVRTNYRKNTEWYGDEPVEYPCSVDWVVIEDGNTKSPGIDIHVVFFYLSDAMELIQEKVSS
jgi:hypothetical protein